MPKIRSVETICIVVSPYLKLVHISVEEKLKLALRTEFGEISLEEVGQK